MTPLFRKILGMNWLILLTMTGLISFGIYAIYTASWMRSTEALTTSSSRQMRFAFVGGLIFLIVSVINYRWIRWAAIPIYLGAILSLFLLNFYGVEKGGAVSWLAIGGFSFQPSQIAITGGILSMGVILSELPKVHPVFQNRFWVLLISAILAGIPFAMILKEPDMGSATIWGPVTLGIWLVGNIPFRYLIALLQIVLFVIPLSYSFVLKEHQKDRIETFIKVRGGEKVDVRGNAWSYIHIPTAIGSGGWHGKGAKGERIKALDPDQRTLNEMGLIAATVAINDFIFAVIAEAWGFRGAMILLASFALLILSSLYVAFLSKDLLGKIIVVGVTTLFLSHIFLNVGMNILLLPVTGVPLPLISYGGTFLVICMFLLGLVNSVWIHRHEEDGEPSTNSTIFYRP